MALKPRNYLCIDPDGGIVTAVEVSKRARRLYLSGYKIAHAVEDAASLPALLSAKPRAGRQGCPPVRDLAVVAALPTQGLLLKSFPAPQPLFRNKDPRREAALFLSRQNLPLKLDECFWHVHYADGFLHLAAARKDAVEKFLAAFRESGLNVTAVVPAVYAVFNFIQYAYGRRDRFIAVQMHADTTDLLVCENTRIWVYPLPAGRSVLNAGQGEMRIFLQEIRRVISTHYMQNACAGAKDRNVLFISGASYPDFFVAELKKVCADYEVTAVEPLKKIETSAAPRPEELPLLTQAVGLGITSLEFAHLVPINLIDEKIKAERFVCRVNMAERLGIYAASGACAALLILNGVLISRIAPERKMLQLSRYEVDTFLPQIKALKEEKEKLLRVREFLRKKTEEQSLYMKALAAVAETKSPFLEIHSFEAKTQDGRLEAFIMGNAADYSEINEFLVKLKNRAGISDVKVVASTLPAAGGGAAIDFKLRFDARVQDQ